MLWVVAAIGIGVMALAHTAPFPFLLEWIGLRRWAQPQSDETAPILQRMIAEGHAIALHSHTRALMLKSPEASDGDVIVMHDGRHDNPRADRDRTVRATTELIPLLRAKGLASAASARPN